MKNILFLWICCCVLVALARGQQPGIILKKDHSGKGARTPLHNTPWRFHAGDDQKYALPSTDDHSWDTVAPAFGSKNLPRQWDGFGWFRVWLKKGDAALPNTWGLHFNHDGASEVYWDGNKVESIGKTGHSKKEMQANRAPYLVIPLAISDTLPHLLALRYSNYNHYFFDFIGFQVWAGDLQQMTVQLDQAREKNDSILLSVAIQLTLILLHLFLFVFYPRQRLNLYYSLFVLSSATALFAKYLYVGTADPAYQLFSDKLFFISINLLSFTGGLLLYGVGYAKLPRIRMILLSLITASFIIAIIFFNQKCDCDKEKSSLWFYSNVFFALVFLDGLWSVIRAMRQRKPGIGLIAAGMLATGLFSIIVGADLFGWFQGNYFLLIRTMAIATLIMPVCFSIYLAMDVARTNRRLEAQLLQNKQLSEGLEQTVLERTAQVREQADKLREMDAVKSRFFVNLTHEFKTPLTLIMNPARELLLKSGSVENKQYASLILRNSERLLQLINQLLDLSKLENRQMEITLAPVELVSWLRTHVRQYESLAQQKTISLTFTATKEQIWIEADQDKLEKIVYNLLSNAFKFTKDKGRVEVMLDSTDQQDNTSIELTVKDHGIGIPAAKLPYIFDRFYQVDPSDTRSREGTGIGLALSKELAELLGGQITVDSKEGEGTLFRLRIPGKKATPYSSMSEQAKQVSGIIEEEQVAANQPELEEENPFVLVVEDNHDLRQFISLSLNNHYRVLTANDGVEGLRMGLEHIPSLVITDLMMPRMDGYAVCDALKKDERTSHIPVIILTAKADINSRIQGIETGADAYLGKPFDKQELLALIENLIRIRSQLRERFGKDNIWLTNASVLPSMEKQFLDRVRQAVETHLDDSQFGADQLGRNIGLSRTQLHRKLKQLINQSPGELIRAIRMRRAHELLQNNIAPVTEVCYMVGYTNPANFSTSFSRHFGYPPSDAAKQKV